MLFDNEVESIVLHELMKTAAILVVWVGFALFIAWVLA